MFPSFLACSCQISHIKAVWDCFHTHTHRGICSFRCMYSFLELPLTFIIEDLGVFEDIQENIREHAFHCAGNLTLEMVQVGHTVFSFVIRVRQRGKWQRSSWLDPRWMPPLCGLLSIILQTAATLSPQSQQVGEGSSWYLFGILLRQIWPWTFSLWGFDEPWYPEITE